MGQRGPRPLPTELLKSRGSWRGDINPDEPKPQVGAPRCPDWLDDAIRPSWDQLVSSLLKTRVLTVDDGSALARYCHMLSIWVECADYIKQNGTVMIVATTGEMKTRPQFNQYKQLAEALLRIEQEYGLTPSSRSRITMVGDNAKPTEDKSRFFPRSAEAG